MESGFRWLRQHRAVNLALVVGYSLFLLFAHDLFVSISVKVMNAVSIPLYQRLVGSILIVSVLAFVVLIAMSVRKYVSDKRAAGYFTAGLLLLVVHFFVLTEMNVEFIHALMYGGLAMLIFPLIGRSGGSVILCLPIMLVDEWYQHIILFPHYTDFYEFNDIVLDLLGAGFFVSLLGMFVPASFRQLLPFHRRVEVWLLFILTVSASVLVLTCVIVPYQKDACEHTWLVLNKLPESTAFWYTHPVIGSTFHILKPLHGLGLVFLMCLAYLGMDPTRSVK